MASSLEANHEQLAGHNAELARRAGINHAVLDATNEAIVLFDPTGKPVLTNPAMDRFLRLLGSPAAPDLLELAARVRVATEGPAGVLEGDRDGRREPGVRRLQRLRAGRATEGVRQLHRPGAEGGRPHHRTAVRDPGRDRGAGGRPAQVRARGHRLARAADAAVEHPRLRRADGHARRRPGGRSPLRPDRAPAGAAADRPDQRLPRPAADRGEAPAADARVVRARRVARRADRGLLGPVRRAPPRAALARRHRVRPRRPGAHRADRRQPALERRQVLAGRRPGAGRRHPAATAASASR